MLSRLHAARFDLRALARLLTFLLFVTLPGVPAPARAAVSPFPPISIGTIPTGGTISGDIVLPLVIPFSAIPASLDATVLYDTVTPAEILALSLLGLSVPVTVGQVKSTFPAWTVSIAIPVVQLDSPTGAFQMSDLGCTAANCSYRVTFHPVTPGTHTAQFTADVASITIQDGGVLGVLVNAFLPFTLGLINAMLVLDLVGAAVSAPVPVPGPGIPEIAVLAALLATAGALALVRRRPQRRQAGGR